MKITNLWISTIFVVSGLLVTGCKSSTEKVEDAEENVLEATEDLATENEAFLLEVEEYKKSTNAQIAANEKSIMDFNARIATQKSNAKVAYEKRIEELNNKNSDMKKKMDDFKSDNRENWEIFKTEFNRDMEELGASFRDFTIKNEK